MLTIPAWRIAFFKRAWWSLGEEGLKRCRKIVRTMGCRLLPYQEQKALFRVQFKNHGDISVCLDKISKRAIEKMTGKSRKKTLPQMTLKTLPQMTLKTPEKVLSLLALKKDITILELIQQIGKSKSAIKRVIQKLQKEGRLKRIGPNKGGHWKVIKKK